MSYYVIIRGPLGCGKSTVAELLSKHIHGVQVPIDRMLDDHHLTQDYEEGYISQRSFLRANELCLPAAREHLQEGTPVIFDGNFYWKSQIEDLIRRLDYPHVVFTLKAPLEVCIARDAARTKSRGSDAARVVYSKSTQFSYGHNIDVTKPLKEVLDAIVGHLPPHR
jgi:predicted kinase